MSTARPGQVDLLARLLRTTRELVAGATPDDRARPTPCTDLDLAALVAHLIGWQRVFAACLRGVPAPIVDGSPTYRPSDDLAGDLHEASQALLVAIAAAPAEVELPYRCRTPVDVLVTELIAETALHAWDVATAMDMRLRLDDHTVAAAHEGLTLSTVLRHEELPATSGSGGRVRWRAGGCGSLSSRTLAPRRGRVSS